MSATTTHLLALPLLSQAFFVEVIPAKIGLYYLAIGLNMWKRQLKTCLLAVGAAKRFQSGSHFMNKSREEQIFEWVKLSNESEKSNALSCQESSKWVSPAIP